MALFNRQEELPIQRRQRQYNATTGWRKVGMDILDTPILSTFNPLGTHFGKELLAQDDDQKALKKQRGRAVSNQLGVAKLASNFIPGLGPVARQVLGGVENITSSNGDDVDMSGVTEELKDAVGQEDAMNNLMSNEDEDVLNISEEDYVSGFDDSSNLGIESDDGEMSDMSGGASKVSNAMGNIEKGLNVAGDLAQVIQGKMAYDKELKSDKKKIFSKQLDNSYYMY